MASNGVLAEYSVPTVNSQPLGIAAGADGALWFTEFAANQIGRITTPGLITEYTVPTSGGRADSRAPVTKLSRLSALRLS